MLRLNFGGDDDDDDDDADDHVSEAELSSVTLGCWGAETQLWWWNSRDRNSEVICMLGCNTCVSVCF